MSENYWGNVLSSFESGAQMDLRVKLAVEFLKSPWGANHINADVPKLLAEAALDLANELLVQAENRGLVKPMPEDDGLSAPLRAHIKRSVRAQVVQQTVGQAIAADEQPKISGVNGARLAGLS